MSLYFKVYHRAKGAAKRTMLAKFLLQVDAINYAADQSQGRYKSPDVSIAVTNTPGEVIMRFRNGRREL